MMNQAFQVRAALACLLLLPLTYAAGAPATIAYTLTTVSRPASLSDYTRMLRGVHALCVETQKLLGRPSVPFLTMPPDFVIDRTTYASDGKAFYFRQKSYLVEMEEYTEASQCRTMITSTSTLARTFATYQEQVGIDRDGVASPVQRVPVNPASYRSRDASEFTAPRTMRGIALKCLAPGSTRRIPGVLADECIVDAGKGQDLRLESGRLISAYLVDELLSSHSGVRIVEPEQLELGKANPAWFTGPLR
ncbi:hypothetical protein [Massilia sp. CF038]|uniref:hypothetical protein n=1 Tax=Massilia sp. CF038 TaxID=1881045 RepID=UPI000916CB01|nr:hypothetical protein [Massilia sp. CF038]SHH24624.1 hypothetical protein SAMN05428948_3496 [Massilia sp. CF038]